MRLPGTVNFSALCSRLPSTCTRRVASTSSSMPPSLKATSTRRPSPSNWVRHTLSACSTRAATLTRSRRSSILPRVMRETSRRSSTSLRLGQASLGRAGPSGQGLCGARVAVSAEQRFRPGRRRLLAVDLAFAVAAVERIGEFAHRLRATEHQEAPHVQRVMQHGKHALLQGGRHVDEDLAAGDQIDVRERRIGGDVLPGEDAHVTDRLGDAAAVLLLLEEAPQTRRRNLGFVAVGTDAAARLLQRAGLA